MNLYDRIKPGKRRRGWGGAVFLAAASYNRDANSPPAAPGGRYGRVFHCY